MPTTDVFSWPYPELGVEPHGPNDIEALAQAIEDTYGDTAFTAFTPTLVTPAGSVAYTNSNGTSVGRYRVWQGWCDLVVCIRFGSAVNGGTNALRLPLPLQAAPSNNPPSQWLLARLWTPSHGHWNGQVYVPSDTSSLGYPYFPLSTTRVDNAQFQNANSSGSNGTGIPAMSGLKTVQATGLFVVNGRYRVV